MLEVIKPATKEGQCAYVDLLRPKRDAHGRPLAAPATVFVSHAWKGVFTELVDAVLESVDGDNSSAGGNGAAGGAKAPAAAYFWLDVMTVNQWRHEALPEDWWSTTFAQARRDVLLSEVSAKSSSRGRHGKTEF